MKQQYKWALYPQDEVDYESLAAHLNIEGNVGWIAVSVFEDDAWWRVLLRRPRV